MARNIVRANLAASPERAVRAELFPPHTVGVVTRSSVLGYAPVGACCMRAEGHVCILGLPGGATPPYPYFSAYENVLLRELRPGERVTFEGV